MAESGWSGVRETVGAVARGTPRLPTYREIGAPIVRSGVIQSRHVQAEWLHRQGGGPVTWRSRQERHAFYYFEHGVLSCRGSLDGRSLTCPLTGQTKLAFVAAGTAVDATVEVPGACRYLVAFVDGSALCEADEALARLDVRESQVGFTEPRLALAMAQLRREIEHQDAVSRLMAESWAMQVWALLHRRQLACRTDDDRALPRSELQRVLDRMRDRLADDVSAVELGMLVGLGPRQFCRRFRASTGRAPGRALSAMRLERAASLLRATRLSVTEIAMECGYAQPQHLATAFRRSFGFSPTDYRAAFT